MISPIASAEEKRRVTAIADRIEFGTPWLVQMRGTALTAAAIKKSCGRSDEVGWDYTCADGSGGWCSPADFASNFVPLSPMVPVTTSQPWGDEGDTRASRGQVDLWKAIAQHVDVQDRSGLITGLQRIVDQDEERAAAFPAVLAELIAERARNEHSAAGDAETREQTVDDDVPAMLAGLAEKFRRDGIPEYSIVTKVGEESGEVIKAYNRSPESQEVVLELGDVAVSALVALAALEHPPMVVLREHIKRQYSRFLGEKPNAELAAKP